MSYFKRLVIKQFPSPIGGQDDANASSSNYWSKFKSPITLKEFASVNSIHFSPTKPFDFVVSASARIQIYETLTSSVKKTISRFSDTVYDAKFRPADGKLILAGDGSGLLQLFDVGSRAILRSFSGHENAVKSVNFSLQNKTQIISGSDDSAVKLWDITSQTPITTLRGHTDYVRSALVSPSSPFLILSSSYDHTIKLWDTREPQTSTTQGEDGEGKQPFTMSMNHGDPVESIVVLPGSSSGFLVASIGGNKLKIWDMLSGGKCIHSLSHHQKMITSMALDGSESYLLTGSLDHHVKMIHLKDYKVVHGIKYPSPVLSLGISPKNTHLAVGMSGGILSVRKRPIKAAESNSSKSVFGMNVSGADESSRLDKIRGGTHSYFMRGSKTYEEAEIRTESRRKHRLHAYEKLLKRFEYSLALDTVLSGSVNPIVVVSMFEELLYRDVMHVALAGRDESSLDPILHFLGKHIMNPRYCGILIEVANIIFDIYEQVMVSSPVLYEQLKRLKATIRNEILLQRRMTPLLGILDGLIASSQIGSTNENSLEATTLETAPITA